ncbi:MAG: hypothetical protein ABTQ32_09395, partial [Myxococcaceae bacterium]
NGAPPVIKTGSPACSQYTYGVGLLKFRNLASNNETSVSLGCTAGSPFSLELVTGSYEVRFDNGGGANGPEPESIVNPNFVVSGAASNVVFNVSGVTVSGRVTINGAPPVIKTGSPACSQYTYGVGLLKFRNLASNNETSVSLGCTAGSPFSLELVTGAYEVRFDNGGGANGPEPESIVNPNFVVSGAASNVVFNVSGVTVSGRVTINGAPPVIKTGSPACSQYTYGVGLLKFKNLASNNETSVSLGCTAGSPFSLELVTGAYEVRFDNGGGANGPEPESIVNPNFVVSGAASNVVFNVSGVTVSGRVTINGAPPVIKTGSPACSQYTYGVGLLKFKNLASNNETSVSLGCTAGSPFSLELVTGNYEVRFDNGGGANGPEPESIVNPNFVVSGAASNVAFNVNGIVVSGRLTINGAAPIIKTGSPACSQYTYGVGLLKFKNLGSGFEASVSLGCTAGSPFSLLLVSGRYEVRFDNGGGANGPEPESIIVPVLQL